MYLGANIITNTRKKTMTKKIELKGRLNGRQRNRLRNLYDMSYKPREIAEEVGFATRQIYRVYIPIGCPHTRDKQNNIWINGKLFKLWYEEKYAKLSLSQDEAFCLTCKKAVKIINSKKEKKGRLHYLTSYCPNCGRKLARITDWEKLDK